LNRVPERITVGAMALPIEFRVLASALAGLLAWNPGSLALAAPPDEFAPVEIQPVELPEREPEPEPEPEIDEDEDVDVDEQDLEPIDDDYDPLRDSAEARDARRWTRSGIAATVVGAALLGGGMAMGLSSACAPTSGNNCFRDAQDRAALTMGVPGGVLLLGGIAMIIVGSVQKRRLRAEFAMTRDRIGFAISGRF
jgi:hypothetical protein